MAEANREPKRSEGVLTQVCVNCGNEYFFESELPPNHMTCERCGGHVFRSFFAVTNADEVEQDFEEMTSRDTAPDDPGTDVVPGDLYDLNNP
ncbi:MAG: hypothetical protein ACRENP_22980 [Longimicrobiales bacterium]